jgi:hypothetical protein
VLSVWSGNAGREVGRIGNPLGAVHSKRLTILFKECYITGRRIATDERSATHGQFCEMGPDA